MPVDLTFRKIALISETSSVILQLHQNWITRTGLQEYSEILHNFSKLQNMIKKQHRNESIFFYASCFRNAVSVTRKIWNTLINSFEQSRSSIWISNWTKFHVQPSNNLMNTKKWKQKWFCTFLKTIEVFWPHVKWIKSQISNYLATISVYMFWVWKEWTQKLFRKH